MGRYNFVNPGALAGNAIEQFLMQREMSQRDQVEQQFKRRQAEEQAQRQAQELALRQQQEQRVAAAQTQQQSDMEQQREFGRAQTITSNAVPGDNVDAPTVDLLTRQGFGGQVQPGIQGPAMPEPFAPGTPAIMVAPPGQATLRGGSQYLNAQAQRESASTTAAANRSATDERAAADRAIREENARMGADARSAATGAQAETTGLRNDLLRTQVDAAQQKQSDKAAADKRAKDAAQVTSGATIDVLKQLADFDANGIAKLKPATANLFGMRNPLAQYVPGSDTATATAAMDRLKGRVIVDLLNEMKNQSNTGATGFGALSRPELTLLENAASQLNSSNITDTRAAEELSRIYQLATRLYGGQTSQAGSGVQKWGRDAQGRPVRLP